MEAINKISILDGIVLFCTVAVSVGIGIFFALRSVSNGKYYFLGNRKLTILPTALSMVVTYQSSLLIVGVPAESYAYGLSFAYRVIGYWMSYGFAIFCIVPVFHPLKITSVYKYFYLRYQNNRVRYLALTMGVVYLVFYMGSVTFGTCVALKVLMGIPYWGTILIYTIITTIYTSIGGMKAVIWTDVFQMVIMCTGVLAVITKCIMTVGGFNELYNFGSSRFDMKAFSLDPTVRYTFWNMTFARFANNLVDCYHQPGIQRIRSLPSIKSARIVFGLASVIKAILTTCVCVEGVAIFAYYSYMGCDPVASGRISTYNELIPLAVSDLFSSIPGLSGLFLATLSSAALSTLSSCLSSLGAVTYDDIIRVIYPNMSQKTATNISKACVLFYGLVAMGFTFMISVLPGSILKLFFALIACIDGPICALFIVSTFSKRATTTGVLIGTVTGMLVTLAFNLGQILLTVPLVETLPPAPISECYGGGNGTVILEYIADGLITGNYTTMPSTSIATAGISHKPSDGLMGNFATMPSTIIATTAGLVRESSFMQSLFSISFMYFSFIGFIVTLLMSLIVSYCTTPLMNVDERCLFSFRKHVLEDMFGKVKSKPGNIGGESTDLMSDI